MKAVDLKPEYRALLDAVTRAGVLLAGLQPAIVSEASFVTKSDKSIVTAADLESEAMLLDALARYARSPFSVVSEEAMGVARQGDGSVWFLDPLDGTANYAKAGSDYAILLSEWREGNPVFSAVHYPATRELGWAYEAANGFNDAVPLGEPSTRVQFCYLHDDDMKSEIDAMAGVQCSQDATESTRALFDLAAGKIAGVVIQICGHGVWDLAASTHLVLASGGVVCDEAGAPIKMSAPLATSKFVVAASDEALGRLLLGALKRRGHGG